MKPRSRLSTADDLFLSQGLSPRQRFFDFDQPTRRSTVYELAPHELSFPPVPETVIEQEIEIDQKNPPARITLRQPIVARGAAAFASPSYLLTKRRRAAAKIQKKVLALVAHADSDGFVVWTQGVLNDLRQIIEELTRAEAYADSSHEGNSCEIFRQLRDSLMNGGAENYRRPDIRLTVVNVLRKLVTLDEIPDEYPFETFTTLLKVGVDPAVGTGIYVENEEEEISG